MIVRDLKNELLQSAKKFPILVVIGPRQSGKTTLIKDTFSEYTYVSLEDLDNREYAERDPRHFLVTYSHRIILDEIQKAPSLLSYLQTKTDAEQISGDYILTGSQNFLLMESLSQSLAGRARIFTLLPLSLHELKKSAYQQELDQTIFNGFYPRLYQAKLDPRDIYPSYIQTYIERDVRQIQNIQDLSIFQKFIKMCAGRTGQLLNLSSLANDCGITHNTAKAWITLLEASFIVFLLQPYHNNFGKRLVKTPKLYFYDTGLACSLLGIENRKQLENHYLRGALFENMIISELLKKRYNHGLLPNLYFWRDQVGHEIDCIVDIAGQLTAIELKSGQTLNRDFFINLDYWHQLTSSSADNLYLVYGGNSDQVQSNGKIISWKNLDLIPTTNEITE
jgi:uncharacterized protein